MKRVLLALALTSSVLASCTDGSIFDRRVYTLSTLDRINYTDIDLDLNWKVVIGKDGEWEYIADHDHKIGDTIEIIHTDYTTSKYILTAIK